MPSGHRWRSLWEAFDAGLLRGAPAGCWEWRGSVNGRGFGQVSFAGTHHRAHRVAWEIFVGPIPGKLQVRHRCGNKLFCNPAHLFLGTPLDVFRNRTCATLEERLWAEVPERRPGECWEWIGRTTTAYGHGKFSWRRQRWIASRAAYHLFKGPIPAGMLVRHKCDNPPCCNPDHLELGDIPDNMRDKFERGRHRPGAEHPMAKLSDDDVRAIRRAPGTGVSIAAQFNISPATVSLIKNRKLWKHLPD